MKYFMIIVTCALFLISCSNPKDIVRSENCGIESRKFNLIKELIYNNEVTMVQPGRGNVTYYISFSQSFKLDSNFTTRYNEPVIQLHNYKLDTIKSRLLKFNSINLNEKIDSAVVEIDFYREARIGNSATYYLKLDTLKCAWVINKSDQFVM